MFAKRISFVFDDGIFHSRNICFRYVGIFFSHIQEICRKKKLLQNFFYHLFFTPNSSCSFWPRKVFIVYQLNFFFSPLKRNFMHFFFTLFFSLHFIMYNVEFISSHNKTSLFYFFFFLSKLISAFLPNFFLLFSFFFFSFSKKSFSFLFFTNDC